MGFDELVIIKSLSWILEWIDDNIDSSILKGLVYIGLIVLSLFIIYKMIYGGIIKHQIWPLYVILVWVIIELANLVGGGHSKNSYQK